MRIATSLAAVLTLTVVAGAVAGVGSPDRVRNTDVREPITRPDMALASAHTVYDAVQQLRPGWIGSDLSRDPEALPLVYIELRCTEITCLRWLEVSQVETVHRLDAELADEVWSSNQSRDVLLVTLHTKPAKLRADVVTR